MPQSKPYNAVAAYRKRHREQGLCIYCPDPAVNKNVCKFHRLKTNARRCAREAERKLSDSP